MKMGKIKKFAKDNYVGIGILAMVAVAEIAIVTIYKKSVEN